MVNAIMALAFATFLNNKPVGSQLQSYTEFGYETCTDWSITEGVKGFNGIGNDYDGTSVFVFCDLDVYGFDYVDYVLCDDCMNAIYDGYDYIAYGDYAHVGDWVTTFECIDDNGECVARWDYVSYCPHNN